MASPKYLKIFVDHVSSLTANDFLDFCDRFLNKIFPTQYDKSIPVTDKGFTIIDKQIFSVIANPSSIASSITSLKPLTKDPLSKIIFLANIASSDASKIKKRIKTKFKAISTEIWEPRTIQEKISPFSDEELTELMGADSTFSNYFKISKDQQIAFSCYQEIFAEIIKRFKGPLRPRFINPNDSEFAKILDKVPLNFSKVQTRFWEIYSNSYQFKNLAEKYIQERYKIDSDFKQNLIEDIHSNFCNIANAPRHNYPVNDTQVIELMAQSCLRPEYKDDPKFRLLARGLIIYFFELCEFGARDQNDQRLYIEPPLFPNYGDMD